MMCVSLLVYTTFSIPHDVCVVTGVHHVFYTTSCVCHYWCTPRFLYHMMCVSLLVYTTFSIPHDTGVHHVLSSKDRLIKESTYFTCEEVELRIFSILSISFNVLILNGYRRSSRKAVLKLSFIVQY